jgi:hypothetical protein
VTRRARCGWAAGLLLAAVVLTPTENGRWQCGLCGKHERRFSILNLTVRSRPLPSAYHDWFVGRDGRPHDHDWVYVGCHNSGNLIWGAICCSMMRMELLEEIPLLTEEKRSRKAVDRLFSMSRDERRSEFRDFDFAHGDRGSPDYSAWWNSHTGWQDIFPPPLPR